MEQNLNNNMIMDQNMMKMIMNNKALFQNIMMNMNQMNQIIDENEYYIINHKNPLKEKQLNRSQINLSLFFNGLSNFKKNIPRTGNQILINYYNLEKIYLYLDLDLNVKELISIIFGSIFFSCDILNIYKRTKSNQTTEWITANPIKYYQDCLGIFSNIFFLEYKNINLLEYSNKTGKEIGLTNGEEILLKIKKNFKDELISLPLDGTYLYLYYDGNFSFPTFDGEITEECKKRLFYLFGCEINYPYSSVFSNKYIKRESIQGRVNLSLEKEICGAGHPIEFPDISKGKTKELKFSKNAPKWRTAQEGLNIFGICCNPECKVYKKEVVFMPNLINQKFNLNENITRIFCPICNTIIKLKTCGLWKCEYQFIGEKIKDGRLVNFNSNPIETKNNEFEYYDPSENGNATWTELIIYIIPKQKIKYKPK